MHNRTDINRRQWNDYYEKIRKEKAEERDHKPTFMDKIGLCKSFLNRKKKNHFNLKGYIKYMFKVWFK